MSHFPILIFNSFTPNKMQPQSNTFAGALADNVISKAIVSEDKPKEITSVSDAPAR